jgi:hypothetical protein
MLSQGSKFEMQTQAGSFVFASNDQKYMSVKIGGLL